MLVRQVAINAGFDFRRYAMKPMLANPKSIITQVDGFEDGQVRETQRRRFSLTIRDETGREKTALRRWRPGVDLRPLLCGMRVAAARLYRVVDRERGLPPDGLGSD